MIKDLCADSLMAEINGILPVYEWGMKLLLAKLEILFDSLSKNGNNSPVEHIKTRIKTPESIINKLKTLNLEISAESAKRNLTDIAGIRIICFYAKDIFNLVNLIKSMPDTVILAEKDYISSPKQSGYRSFHIIAEVIVYHQGLTEKVPVEVQIRTEAMDFWATLEHRVRYKYKSHIPDHLNNELIICADKIAELDSRMFLIHEIISLINQD